MVKYFFRLDDIAPNMNWDNFYKIRQVLDKYNVKPLIAIIPDARDSKLLFRPYNPDFWSIIKNLSENGWTVGQHGYRHLSSGNGGILKIHSNGEFGGLGLEKQKSMIASGREIIKKNLSDPKIFIAPRHSFDKNTVVALKSADFNFVSDGIALYPFKKWGIIWLPQILWRPRKWLFGKITVALHPNTMTDKDFDNLEKFFENNRSKTSDFSELMKWRQNASSFKLFFVFLINLFFKPIWRTAFRLKT